ncbi:hydrogenase maturation nickel metallochaperone HypA [Uniformispora flossi]|uniref:hydrogenase maturation nickel metallochaperone HypA n=1 Tax=Uniformispora flossi TaxID=3390723 RepID=UPI003C2FAA08
MHEMSVALALVDHVAEAARADGRERALAVHVQIGELAGVVADALDFAFELAREGTPLEGARLVVETVPARARCRDCAAEFAVGAPPDLACRGCGGTNVELSHGRELRITAVEWADGPAYAASADRKG